MKSPRISACRLVLASATGLALFGCSSQAGITGVDGAAGASGQAGSGNRIDGSVGGSGGNGGGSVGSGGTPGTGGSVPMEDAARMQKPCSPPTIRTWSSRICDSPEYRCHTDSLAI
jgi:hypothetical protein